MREHRMLPGILFGCLFAFATIAMPAGAQTVAPNEWTWIGGSSSGNPCDTCFGQPGVYGTLGTPAASNIPGGRDTAATWTDSSGNFWLFGGEGVDANGNFGLLNDLWEFQPSTQQWIWMGGNSTIPASCVATSTTTRCGQPGVYGSLGSPAAANIPGGRSAASYGTDDIGNFWLFAGYGFDADQNQGDLNDLWEFNPSTKQWTWMGGRSSIGGNGGQPGVYGTLGSVAAANIPGSRDSAANWVDKSGQLWIYGGNGLDSHANYGQLDDLWKLDPATHEWTWMGGRSTLPAICATNSFNQGLCGWPENYGTLGVSAPGVSPGSRVEADGWIDNDGNLWLFGGLGSVLAEGLDFSELDQHDLWEFNPSTQQWAWMSGNSTVNCGGSSPYGGCVPYGNYGVQGIPAIGNIPPPRDNATSWTDTNGNLWIFGGSESITISGEGGVCNDVWVFEPAANEWAWMDGGLAVGIDSPACNINAGIYGVLGTPAASNTPPGRLGAAKWTDASGNLWIFGGFYRGGAIFFLDLNDLWLYKPVAPAPEPSFEFVASPNPINIAAFGAATPITVGTTTVSVFAADGFDSPVALTAESGTCNGTPCISGSFSPTTITGAGSSTLTISVTGAAFLIPSPYAFYITATSGGVSQSLLINVDVTGVGQLSAPSFSVPAGTYITPQTVTITGATPNENDFIYYTTDGSTPTASSAVYVNPITIASTTTLKAIRILDAGTQSIVSSATYTIQPIPPSFSIVGPAVSVVPGAATGNTSIISLTPSGGFTGVISLSCAITPTAASDAATCSIPASATISGTTAQTVTLTVNTTSATSALNRVRGSLWPLVGDTALACILLVGFPARQRRRRSILGMLVLLACVIGGALGCGGSGNGAGGGGEGNSGTTPGTYVITVTGTSGAITQTGTISLSVQ